MSGTDSLTVFLKINIAADFTYDLTYKRDKDTINITKHCVRRRVARWP